MLPDILASRSLLPSLLAPILQVPRTQCGVSEIVLQLIYKNNTLYTAYRYQGYWAEMWLHILKGGQ